MVIVDKRNIGKIYRRGGGEDVKGARTHQGTGAVHRVFYYPLSKGVRGGDGNGGAK